MVVSNDVRWKYDREGDVLYIIVNPMTETYEVEDPECEGLYIRRALRDDSVVGAIVLWFSRQDPNEIKSRLPFRFDPSVVH